MIRLPKSGQSSKLIGPRLKVRANPLDIRYSGKALLIHHSAGSYRALLKSASVTVFDATLIAAFKRTALARALEGLDLVLTVTPGRSGTKLLRELLASVMNLNAEHEPVPRANFHLRRTLEDQNYGLRWLIEEKLPHLQHYAPGQYIETSHLYCKGFIEIFWALGLRPRFIILRRSPSAVARSLFKISCIPGRTPSGQLVLISPRDGATPFPRHDLASDYQLCYWYAKELYRRQNFYVRQFSENGTAYFELTIEDLVNLERFCELARFLDGTWSGEKHRAAFSHVIAENQHPRSAINPYGEDAPLPGDTEAQEAVVDALFI